MPFIYINLTLGNMKICYSPLKGNFWLTEIISLLKGWSPRRNNSKAWDGIELEVNGFFHLRRVVFMEGALTLKSHWQGDIVPLDFTVNAVPCSHSTLLQNNPYNIQNPTFHLKRSLICLSYAVHTREMTWSRILSSYLTFREVTQERPLNSLYLLVPVCFRAISLWDWWQDAYFFLPCNAIQAGRSLLWSILLMLHGTVLSEYVVEGYFCLVG